MINTTITSEELKKYIQSQISHFIPDRIDVMESLKIEDIGKALDKCEICFSHIKNSAYSDENGNTFFSYLHADQYATFLVILACNIWKERQDKNVCDRIMYLNRVLHSFMMSYKCHLPDIFMLGHPVGSVIGNAEYSDYLYISQNCTINTGTVDENGNCTPKIGKYFAMGAGAVLVGDKPIGDNCSIGAGAMLYNTALEDNSIVINNCGSMEIRKSKGISLAQKLFR